MKSFSSKNLLMRPLAAQDQHMFCALYTDEKTMRYIEPAFSQVKAIKAFNSFIKGNANSSSGFSTWAIVSKNSGKTTLAQQNIALSSLSVPAIGFVMFYNKAGKQPLKITEIGILLLAQARGKQLAQEAFGALLSYGFTQLELPYINVRFDKRNLAIRRITRNLGFVYYQSFADDVFLNTPKGNFNHNNMDLETISFSHWQDHTPLYKIELELS